MPCSESKNSYPRNNLYFLVVFGLRPDGDVMLFWLGVCMFGVLCSQWPCRTLISKQFLCLPAANQLQVVVLAHPGGLMGCASSSALPIERPAQARMFYV